MAQIPVHKMFKKRGQAAAEIFFAIGFIMLIFILIAALNIERGQGVNKAKETIEESDLCSQISSAISSVYSKGPGTSSKIDFSNHNISFNAENQVATIDDKYPCRIPLRDITNGTSPIFDFTQKNLRIENRNNIVYINSNCIVYPVEYAIDEKGVIVTSKVKNKDDVYANITFTIQTNTSISNYSQWLIDNYINISFIDVGNECPDSQMNAILKDFGCSDDFQQGQAPPTTNCHIYHDNGHLNQFFTDDKLLPGYKIVVMEQEELSTGQLEDLEEWIEEGGILIYGDKISSASSNRFGSRWNYVKTDQSLYNLTALDSFYTSPDPYLELGGSITNKATWDPDAQHYTTDCIGCNPDAANYTVIARFPNSNDAISRWELGNGTVYHFSSLCHPNDIYNTGILTIKLNEMLKRILGFNQIGYLDTRFAYEPQLGSTSTISNKTTLKYRISNPPSYYNIQISEKLNNNNLVLKCTRQNITNEQCDFSPSNPFESNINIRTEFISTNIIDKTRTADIDYQNIEICYNY